MPAPDIILELVAHFERHADVFRSAAYREAQVRQEFINPMFGLQCLGWDMDNRRQASEANKDVIHEASIKIGGATKAPDYGFRLNGLKFYVEAKKPGINLKTDPVPVYQLRRYAWSAKLPLSILTNFEEFAVYDCRVKPAPTDKASTARIRYLTCSEYAEHWDEIANVFSRAAVDRGSFDKYAETAKGKRGTATVDTAFLREIESWREVFAKDIAKNNPRLDQRELNYAVQVTIDRIIFLRMCEDRGIEQYARLLGLVNGPKIYERLKQLFRDADDRYNSGLFFFHKDKDRAEPPDDLTPRLTIGDDSLKRIIKGLYYPDCPYEFGVLPVEILGQVYEQFLGKVIRLTAGHQAKVEDKPEVKKAGGVYYTPRYIVDYIVEHTVGRLLYGEPDLLPSPPASGGEGQGVRGVESPKTLTPSSSPAKPGEGSKILTPKQAAKLRILDPACGSGSFLLGAYQYLLDWHRDWYVADGPEKHTKELYQAKSGDWRLTTSEKKRILLANIYGVDIDPQAVEVTKLSLLLKVLEGESHESLESRRRMFHERALPDLASNIKCGNSLIGPDFYNGQQRSLFDEEEQFRVNVFDWHAAFPAIMKAGGFDAVIGNPPYVLLQDEFRDDHQLAYFRANFTVASYKLDTYHLFMERGIRLTRNGGRCSMITPANFLTNNFLVGLRRFLLEHSRIGHILVIDAGVFEGASVDNAIFVVASGEPTTTAFELVHANRENGSLRQRDRTTVVKQTIDQEFLLFTASGGALVEKLWQRIAKIGKPLGALADVNFGKQLRDRSQFPKDVISLGEGRSIPRGYRACYTGRDVLRYRVNWSNLACIESAIARRGGCWDREKHDAKDKLLTRQIGRYPDFALDPSGYQCLNTMFMVNPKANSIEPRFLLGVLNSKLLRRYWSDRYYDRRRTFPKIKGTYLKQLPVILMDGENPKDKSRHDRLVALVEQMLALHKQLAKAKSPPARSSLEHQIAATDRQIDRLVYDLYGLTEEEIRIVEERTEG